MAVQLDRAERCSAAVMGALVRWVGHAAVAIRVLGRQGSPIAGPQHESGSEIVDFLEIEGSGARCNGQGPKRAPRLTLSDHLVDLYVTHQGSRLPTPSRVWDSDLAPCQQRLPARLTPLQNGFDRTMFCLPGSCQSGNPI